MNMTKPKISVLVPVYNSEKYLKACIESVLAQTMDDFELILLNDASTDGSEAVIKNFSDPRIRYFCNEKNLGISGSRNHLLSLARGEYLVILDNDDLALPQRFAKQSAYLDAHPEVAMLGSWGELFSSAQAKTFKEKIKKLITNLGWVWCQPPFPDMMETLRGNTVMHSSMMLRRQMMEQHHILYNADYTPAEDYDLLRQFLAAGLKVVNLQEVLFKYHLHGGNFSLQQKGKMQKADAMVKADLRQALGLSDFRYPYWKTMLKKLRWKYLLLRK